ncbi:hypothetical protein QFZ76_006117 [Streptomyces sp. V4I2]|nr:hypothetical protein [Streptomyces sp. V4I2]
MPRVALRRRTAAEVTDPVPAPRTPVLGRERYRAARGAGGPDRGVGGGAGALLPVRPRRRPGLQGRRPYPLKLHRPVPHGLPRLRLGRASPAHDRQRRMERRQPKPAAAGGHRPHSGRSHTALVRPSASAEHPVMTPLGTPAGPTSSPGRAARGPHRPGDHPRVPGTRPATGAGSVLKAPTDSEEARTTEVVRAPSGARAGATRSGQQAYLLILVTWPAPTVRPPSRIANFRPSSMATGWMSSTFISVLSPGMTISVPSGRVTTPVTSVVRK